MHVESYVKISRCVENVYVRHVENHIENRVEVRKKTPSHFTARVEIERQISFFSFGFARVSEVRHMYSACKTIGYICQQSTAAQFLAAGTVVKTQSHFVWMRMPKIKPLHTLYRLITDTELCFSAEVN